MHGLCRAALFAGACSWSLCAGAQAEPYDETKNYGLGMDILAYVDDPSTELYPDELAWVRSFLQHGVGFWERAPDARQLLRRLTPASDPPLIEGVPVPIPGTKLVGCPATKAAVWHPNGRYVYYATAGGIAGAVCGFAYDDATRALTKLPGTPVLAGAGSRSIALDPAGRFLFTANQDANNVSGFRVDAATGALAPVPGSPFAAGAAPRAVAVDPSGRFVYVANHGTGSGSISGYRLDRGTGALTPLAGSPYPAPTTANGIVIEPRGKYLYLAAGSIRTYAIDATSGALAQAGPDIAQFGKGIALDPTGRIAVISVFTGTGGTLTSYRVQPGGMLAPISTRAIGDAPLGVAVSRSGRFAYVSDILAGVVAGFRLDSVTGALTAVAGSPFATPSNKAYGLATTGSVRDGTVWAVGEPYVQPVAIAGGRPPYTWSLVSGALPPGLAISAEIGVLEGTPTTTGVYAFTLGVVDGAGSVTTRSFRFAVVTLPALATVVEYYNAALDHYFITWVAAEIAKLDVGTEIRGWTRTGRSFTTLLADVPGWSPICRYYIPPGLGDSHFFGRGTEECTATGAANPSFQLEDPAFMRMGLPDGGVCLPDSVPVYRVFSGRPDANHRYMTDRALRDEMVGRGWVAEGDGPDLVVMCAPGVI